MLTEEIRSLLYPLGILSTIAFTLRFVIQWVQSERAHQSIVSPSFWWLSLLGNFLLGLHSLIQSQYPICLVQAINAVIACRNLNLMQAPLAQWRFSSVLWLMLTALIAPTLTFWLTSNGEWFRIPTHAFQLTQQPISFIWHLIGTLGVVLFASRFWVQWIQAEQAHKSSLELPFWWLSLIGALFSLLYFALIRDYVNLVGPLFGIIPYCRNLILLKQKG